MTMKSRYRGCSPRTPLHYNWCGLDNIYLLSGYERLPDADGDDICVHNLDGLHRAIGERLARHKKELTGKDLRFLRQQMDLTQSELGDLMGTTDQTVARWEKGETEMSGPASTLARLLYFSHVRESIDLQSLLKSLRQSDAPLHDDLIFQETDSGWQEGAQPSILTPRRTQRRHV